MAVQSSRKQLNIRLEPSLHRALGTMARQERRSLPQMALVLIEEGMRCRAGLEARGEEAPAGEIAALALSGGSFDWLAEEPELYDDTCGEPV